ncbi:MAG: hypothetical protein CME22_01095 [Gemmatimonadetes bacterium]|nr:hypothetical protein [Gemmatimonadota bacterium]
MYRPINRREKPDRSQLFAFTVVLLSLVLLYLPPQLQETPAYLVRATILKPFILAQEYLIERKVHSIQVEVLQSRVDSLLMVITNQANLKEENTRIKELLGVTDKIPHHHISSNVIRPGTTGSEGLFLLNVGADQGISVSDPVILGEGLLGLVQEVQRSSAVGMDWTHFQFRASAMTKDGTVYGLVRADAGGFREADRLLIDGVPFHQELDSGVVLVTSGLGGVYPRGIPIGEISTEAESSLGWRRSYWVTPFVFPGEAVHAVVVSPSADQLSYEKLWDFSSGAGSLSRPVEDIVGSDSVANN